MEWHPVARLHALRLIADVPIPLQQVIYIPQRQAVGVE